MMFTHEIVWFSVITGGALVVWIIAARRYVLAERCRVDADQRFTQAERTLLAAEGKERRAQKDFADAAQFLVQAKAAEEEARRIEESLVRPRFVMDPQGGFRVLAAREERREDEHYCQEPSRACRDCYGKGWTKRNHDTGQVVPCKCIKVRR